MRELSQRGRISRGEGQGCGVARGGDGHLRRGLSGCGRVKEEKEEEEEEGV